MDDRFTLTNDQVAVNGKRVRTANLGWVRMRESLRLGGRISSATVSKRADRWFIRFSMEIEDTPKRSGTRPEGTRAGGVVGVDLGVKRFATLSTGESIPGPKPHETLLERQRRLARSLARKRKGSRNHAKVKRKLARLHDRMANIHLEATHNLTTRLTREFDTIAMEDLNVRGMLNDHQLARAIRDMAFHEVRRQLATKSEERGNQLLVADRWFASSRVCHACS